LGLVKRFYLISRLHPAHTPHLLHFRVLSDIKNNNKNKKKTTSRLQFQEQESLPIILRA